MRQRAKRKGRKADQVSSTTSGICFLLFVVCVSVCWSAWEWLDGCVAVSRPSVGEKKLKRKESRAAVERRGGNETRK